jgi:hypothetical protein
MTWCDTTRAVAAKSVAEVLAKEIGTLTDALADVQRSRLLDGPYVVKKPGSNGQPFEILRDRLATVEDLERGAVIGVDLIQKVPPRDVISVPVPLAIAKVVRRLREARE